MAKIIKMQPEKHAIVKRAQNNERLAQKQLYEAYAPAMLSVCRLYVTDLHFAEDIMIKGFLKIFTNLNQYQEQNHLYAWMRRIMVNECIDFLRSSINKNPFSEWEETFDSREDFVLDQVEDTEYIQKLIDELPESCKAIFNLYVFEDYTHKQIAEQLGISEGTSKSQLAYAKKKLKEKLKTSYDYAK